MLNYHKMKALIIFDIKYYPQPTNIPDLNFIFFTFQNNLCQLLLISNNYFVVYYHFTI